MGKTKSDIVAVVGAPLYKDVLNEAVDIGNGDKLVKTEEFTYKLKGSIGGMYIVLIRFENNIHGHPAYPLGFCNMAIWAYIENVCYY